MWFAPWLVPDYHGLDLPWYEAALTQSGMASERLDCHISPKLRYAGRIFRMHHAQDLRDPTAPALFRRSKTP
jgi:hypothetical protein